MGRLLIVPLVLAALAGSCLAINITTQKVFDQSAFPATRPPLWPGMRTTVNESLSAVCTKVCAAPSLHAAHSRRPHAPERRGAAPGVQGRNCCVTSGRH